MGCVARRRSIRISLPARGSGPDGREPFAAFEDGCTVSVSNSEENADGPGILLYRPAVATPRVLGVGPAEAGLSWRGRDGVVPE